MTDIQLYSEISSLPSDLKQEVSDFVAFLKQKSKKQSKLNSEKLEEPFTVYKSKLSDILLKGPVFSEDQIQNIDKARKSINEWRTK